MPRVKGYTKRVKGKTIRVKGYTRKNPRGRKNPGAAWHKESQKDVSAFPGMTRYDKGWNDGYKTAHSLSEREAERISMRNLRRRKRR